MIALSGVFKGQGTVLNKQLTEDLVHLNEVFSKPRARLDLQMLEEYKQLVAFLNLNMIPDDNLKLIPSGIVLKLQLEARKL